MSHLGTNCAEMRHRRLKVAFLTKVNAVARNRFWVHLLRTIDLRSVAKVSCA